jgi:hypothetical protein
MIYLVLGLFSGSTWRRDLIMADRSDENTAGILGYTPFKTFWNRPFMSAA